MGESDQGPFLLEFQKTDTAVHRSDNHENICRVFERVDNCLADVLIAVNGEPNIFVTSDHGIGQETSWSVALNSWLVEQGYAETIINEDQKKTKWTEQATGSDSSNNASTI